MKNLFKAAHKMTKEIAAKYDVDYRAQFQICLSYLAENRGDVKEMKELKGTEKQVAWASELQQHAVAVVDYLAENIETLSFKREQKKERAAQQIAAMKETIELSDDAVFFINAFKGCKGEIKNDVAKFRNNIDELEIAGIKTALLFQVADRLAKNFY